MKRRQTSLTLALWTLILIALCVMVFSAQKLRETQRVYAEGDQNYDDLIGLVRKSATPEEAVDYPIFPKVPRAESQVEIPELDIDFAALKAVNQDAAAWLYCPDTPIDYPVMTARDYSYYLYRLPDGTKNANGSLFIDYNSAPDFSGLLAVIYGHHMKSGRMFGSLVGYKDQGYYENHPYLYLYTELGNYRIDLLYGCVIGAGQWRDRAFIYAENVNALLAYGAHNTTFSSGSAYAEGDRIIALSTCSYEFDDARYVVIGILRQEYEGA